MADYQDLVWPQRPRPTDPCRSAEGFGAFCTNLIARLDQVQAADLETGFAHAKLFLLDRYTDYLMDTPIDHTNAAGIQTHRCLTDVLNETVKAIRERQRMALPPELALPTPAKQPTPLSPQTATPPRKKTLAEAMALALLDVY